MKVVLVLAIQEYEPMEVTVHILHEIEQTSAASYFPMDEIGEKYGGLRVGWMHGTDWVVVGSDSTKDVWPQIDVQVEKIGNVTILAGLLG